MYVCVCHAFTDGQVRRIAPDCDGTVAGLYRGLGVQPSCGKCVPMVRDIVRATTVERLTAEATAL
ncbi:MAG TPA: (2Fe-2S)-binding protein [Stellaceae bacterium]|nr:(2Fe-2S)-binding protein [Stellaceae bacterium]